MQLPFQQVFTVIMDFDGTSCATQFLTGSAQLALKLWLDDLSLGGMYGLTDEQREELLQSVEASQYRLSPLGDLTNVWWATVGPENGRVALLHIVQSFLPFAAMAAAGGQGVTVAGVAIQAGRGVTDPGVYLQPGKSFIGPAAAIDASKTVTISPAAPVEAGKSVAPPAAPVEVAKSAANEPAAFMGPGKSFSGPAAFIEASMCFTGPAANLDTKDIVVDPAVDIDLENFVFPFPPDSDPPK